MTSAPIRDRLADHLLTPENAASLLIDCQPSQAAPCPSRMELTFHFARATVEAGNARGDRLAA